MALSLKTDVRAFWTQLPFAFHFKMYLFNYTNPDEVQKGGIPIVQEIGPYYFDKWTEKVEIQDHEEDDTVSYKRKNTYYFNKKLSGPGLTGDEIIVLPNIFLLAVAQVVNREKPSMISMVGKAIKGIYDNPANVFMTVRAMDLMFDGIIINCARTEFAPKAVCTALKKEAANLVFEPNNQYRFSLFGMSNGTVENHVIKVKRGIKNVMDVAQVVSIDDEPQLSIWKDHCNEYNGTDGTVFAPFLQPTDSPRSYSIDLCRSFKPLYQKKTSYSGIKSFRYVASIGDFANDPELNCFCEAPDQCPKKGLMDVYKCMKAPLYASLPHYLDSDPSLLQNVKGLNPDEDSHGILVDFEPITGTPLHAHQRVQFNIELKKLEKVELCANLSDTMAPLFWVNEGLALNKTFIKMMNNQLFIPKRVVGVIKWLMVSFGAMGMIGAAIFHYKDKIMKFAVDSGSAQVTKVRPEEQKDISVIGLGESQPPTKVEM